jgi:hypothetical protein
MHTYKVNMILFHGHDCIYVATQYIFSIWHTGPYPWLHLYFTLFQGNHLVSFTSLSTSLSFYVLLSCTLLSISSLPLSVIRNTTSYSSFLSSSSFRFLCPSSCCHHGSWSSASRPSYPPIHISATLLLLLLAVPSVAWRMVPCSTTVQLLKAFVIAGS